MKLDTTLGDLICAISDAAREASVEEEDVAHLTHIILNSLQVQLPDDL